MEIYFNNQTRSFGVKSAALGIISPGAWHAKEAAKYMNSNKDDYKDSRAKYAVRGHFTPYTATKMHRLAAKLNDEGKSPKQIREIIEKRAGDMGPAEVALNYLTPAGLVTSGYAVGAGLHDKITGKYRKKFK